MATTDPVGNPSGFFSSCFLWVAVAFCAGLAITIAAWWFVARVDPADAPRGEGPIEAAEHPKPID